MLRFPCLVLDHDDTVVQSEQTVNYPCFVEFLAQVRPGATITLQEYTKGCYELGFVEMCCKWYGFSDAELDAEYRFWQAYVQDHIPDPYPGIQRILERQKASGGIICVVSHSCEMNIRRDYERHFHMQPDAIYGWDLPEALRKPSPYPLRDIMKRFALEPEALLVVDDMRPAYRMASSAGVPIAFAAWGRQEYPQILEEMTALCDYAFQTTADLEQFLFPGV